MTALKTETREELKSYIARIERLVEKIQALKDDQRALFADAKAKGFDPKAMRRIIKRRQKKQVDIDEPRDHRSHLHACARHGDRCAVACAGRGARPLTDDELAMQAALLAIDAGETIETEMLRHLIGAGFARATTARVVVTDEGRAFLAQLVAPMAARADATIQTSERVRQ